MQYQEISAVVNKKINSSKNKNALAFCVDDKYLPYALFVANQFIEKHPDLPCDICICMPDVSQVPEILKENSIRFIEISIDGIEDMPIGQLSLAAYYRLFLPQIFESTYEYIIYLDADTYINKPFYNDLIDCIKDFETDFSIAAAADISELQIRLKPNQKLKKVENYVLSYHKHDHIYRNSGVLVFNTAVYNRENILNQIFDYANNNIDRLQCHDQSALNGALLRNIKLLPFSFNWQVHKLTYDLIDAANPHILHFISDSKPWSLDNYLTKDYQQSYVIFLQKYFPNIELSILTAEEKRAKAPKYNKPAREFISVKGNKLKGKLFSKKIHSTKSLNLTKEKLSGSPFYISIDNR